MTNSAPSLPPGFRFHPTDEELILHYLRNRDASSPCPASIIAEVDIYKLDPWDLPRMAMFGDKEWYFLSPRDRKYPNGVRPNRAAGSGYWKATGTDKPIVTGKGNENIGVKKALVFYKGKPPRGIKTNWIMHEYRLSESTNKSSIRPLKLKDSSMRLDDWVLCRIYQKSSHLQEDSVGIESNIPTLPNNSTQDSNLKLHKSCSLSELLNEADFTLLSRLLETPIEMPASEKCSFDYNYQETDPSALIAENSLKRERLVEDGVNLVQPSKRNNNSWVYNNFANQFDSQSFCNQQLLLNSHLGLQ